MSDGKKRPLRFLSKILTDIGGEMVRSVNRWVGERVTLDNLFRDVRKLKVTPIDGDVIARIRRG